MEIIFSTKNLIPVSGEEELLATWQLRQLSLYANTKIAMMDILEN